MHKRTAPAHPQVQLDIRQGHAQTVDKVLKWFDEEGGVGGATIADCGCGTGARGWPRRRGGCPPRATNTAAPLFPHKYSQILHAHMHTNTHNTHKHTRRAGSLAIPLALQGAQVYATDISSSMAGEAERRYQAAAAGAGTKGSAVFEAKDLE